MSRFNKLSDTVCIVSIKSSGFLNHRYRILRGSIKKEAEECIRAFAQQQHSEIIELNAQLDHVHLLEKIPPKVSVSDFVGTVKGRTAFVC